MPLLVKTQRVMGWETLLWCNQIANCPSKENSPSTERTSVRSVWAVRVAFVAACPREWGCAGGRGEVLGAEARPRSVDGPVVPALPCAVKPRQLRRIRSHARRALLAMVIRARCSAACAESDRK